MQRLISQIGRSQRLAVVNLLKRSQGLTVRELAHRLGMSYMGVKQHCLNLERDGYLGTFRRHRGVGRPELLYHLTNKAQDLFPQADNMLSISLLEQARKLYGTTAAEKILFLHFQEKAKAYARRCRGRRLSIAREAWPDLRDREGHMSDFELNRRRASSSGITLCKRFSMLSPRPRRWSATCFSVCSGLRSVGSNGRRVGRRVHLFDSGNGDLRP